MSTDTLTTALAYLKAGLSLIPIARDGTKAPDGRLLPEVPDKDTGKRRRSWDPFREAPPSERQVRRWYDWPDPPGIAVVGGRPSGNLEQIDFDRDADTIFPAWCQLVEEERPGLIARLSVARTPKPGYHVCYRCQGVVIPGNSKLAVDPSAKGKARTLVETRGEGGYALAPGSPSECHESGRTYEHHSGPPLHQVQDVSPEEREVLIRCAQSFTCEAGEESRHARNGTAGGELRPGEDYSRRGPGWAEVLEPHGWTFVRQAGDRARTPPAGAPRRAARARRAWSCSAASRKTWPPSRGPAAASPAPVTTGSPSTPPQPRRRLRRCRQGPGGAGLR
jgi:putative DNA primase/helicase